MSTPSPERPADRVDGERDLAGPITTLVLLLAVLAGAAFWGTDLVSGTAPGSAADPVTVRIPAIDVEASVEPLFIDDDRALPPPDTYEAPAGGTRVRSRARRVRR